MILSTVPHRVLGPPLLNLDLIDDDDDVDDDDELSEILTIANLRHTVSRI